VLNDEVDGVSREVKMLRDELVEIEGASEATYLQFQRVQTSIKRSTIENKARDVRAEDMGETVSDMTKILGRFTIGLRGIEGMKRTMVNQHSSSEKANATVFGRKSEKPPVCQKNPINSRYWGPTFFLIWTCPDDAQLLRRVAPRCRVPHFTTLVFSHSAISSCLGGTGSTLYEA